ncbi:MULTISPECIES: oxygenase MpaB family protein [unclassified Plantibacter]|uniref:oxygenase MpaB family protein n=1 Tax=unclassified Plantibacter TaxID=2624265 RepID=UPI003D347092
MTSMADLARESILIAGAGRAILLQIADPAIGAGVARHSDFSERPLDRLHATLTFVYALALGTEEEQRDVARSVNRAHVPVRSHDGDAAPVYSAFDPQLQLWVAATLYDTAVQVYELIYGPMSDADADRVYREYAIVGTSLQLPVGMWPESRTAFSRYWDERVAMLEVTPEAVRVSRELLTARATPSAVRSLLPLARLATAALLPASLRAPFGFRWSARQQRRFDRRLAVARVVWPMLPRSVRGAAASYYLARLRAGASV